MKLYLLPPSEGKAPGWIDASMSRFFDLPVPYEILENATAKDLKCTGKRFEEAMMLNKSIDTSPVLPAMQRYTGVLYTAFGYATMTTEQQHWIDEHALILSWLFGLVKPTDLIANYKLPIETKWLRAYRLTHCTDVLIAYCQKNRVDEILDLLPWSYQRMIDRKMIQKAEIVHSIPDLSFAGKVTHMIKAIRWAWLREQCIHHTSI
jgi:cytoplasmic iron level regulating protein YaaA (DUF328/UPF0246 family)